VYLLVDTSGSMRGEPIQSVNVGLESLVTALRRDPYALETVYISVISFDRDARVVVPLTALDELQLPTIATPESGPTHLGKALQLLCERVDKEIIRTTAEQKGDWLPFLFVMTDGSPSDTALFNSQVKEIRSRMFAQIIGCAAGHRAQRKFLEEFCTMVVSLDTMDSVSFASFFKWVSRAVSVGNRSLGSVVEIPLPPSPAEVQVVV
jgi:uncharacterized protein YegL